MFKHRRRRLRWIAFAALAAAVLAAGLLMLWQRGALGPPWRGQADAADPPATARPEPPPPPPPPELQARLQALGEAFDKAGKDERVGLAVRDVQAGWTAGYDLQAFYPQQSVSKLWVAVAVLKLADQGRLHLNDVLLVRRDDLSVFYQPIRACVGPEGYPASIEELLTRQITESDNAANDMLMRRAGGPGAVRRLLRRLGVRGVRTGLEERELQAQIAGLQWRPEYGEGWNFQLAREQLPLDYRTEKLQAYLADPADGATPAGVVDALARLQRGELLSPASTRRLLDIMERVLTGTRRLRAGLPPGWRIAHKTGTGQDLGALSTGYNDVGLVTAPDGHAYAVAVMIASTRRPVGARMAFMAKVARELVGFHERAAPAAGDGEDSGGEESGGPEANPDESRPLSGRVRCFEFPPRMTAR